MAGFLGMALSGVDVKRDHTLSTGVGPAQQAPAGGWVTGRFSMLMKKEFDPERGQRSVPRMVEQVLGCKWTLRVLAAIRGGVVRPGALERDIAGISTKVLNERLRKLVRFGVVERRAFPEVPPRVEYRLTPFGRRFSRVLDAVEALEAESADRPVRG